MLFLMVLMYQLLEASHCLIKIPRRSLPSVCQHASSALTLLCPPSPVNLWCSLHKGTERGGGDSRVKLVYALGVISAKQKKYSMRQQYFLCAGNYQYRYFFSSHDLLVDEHVSCSWKGSYVGGQQARKRMSEQWQATKGERGVSAFFHRRWRVLCGQQAMAQAIRQKQDREFLRKDYCHGSLV